MILTEERNGIIFSANELRTLINWACQDGTLCAVHLRGIPSGRKRWAGSTVASATDGHKALVLSTYPATGTVLEGDFYLDVAPLREAVRGARAKDLVLLLPTEGRQYRAPLAEQAGSANTMHRSASAMEWTAGLSGKLTLASAYPPDIEHVMPALPKQNETIDECHAVRAFDMSFLSAVGALGKVTRGKGLHVHFPKHNLDPALFWTYDVIYEGSPWVEAVVMPMRCR